MRSNEAHKIDLEALKGSIRIIDLARSLGLEVRGTQARCFRASQHRHGDRHPSLGFDLRTNRFKCFACGVSGDVIDLYKEVMGVSFAEAVERLAEMAGFSQARPGGYREPSRGDKGGCVSGATDAGGVGVDVVGVYEALWRYCGGVDEPSLAYLMGASRGLTRETITRFKLFSIQDYSATNDYLRENFGLGLLKEAGLVSDGGNLIFFQHRLIIPFIEEGRIVFLQARRIDDGHPRYMHLKRPVPLYNKDTLKGLNEGDRVYICEGVFDAMIMEQEGYRAVAILGVNSFKPEMVGLFRGLEVVLCLDNDESGRRGVETIARMFWEQGQIVRQKVLPEGVKDITEYFLRHRTIGEFKNPTKKEAGDETSSN